MNKNKMKEKIKLLASDLKELFKKGNKINVSEDSLKIKYRKTIFYIFATGMLILLLILIIFAINKPKKIGDIAVNSNGSIISKQEENEKKENKKNSSKNDEKEIENISKKLIETEYNAYKPSKIEDNLIQKDGKIYRYYLDRRRIAQIEELRKANLSDLSKVKSCKLEKLDYDKIKIRGDYAMAEINFAFSYEIDTGIEVLSMYYENAITVSLKKEKNRWKIYASYLSQDYPNINKYDKTDNIDVLETVQLPYEKAKQVIDDVMIKK